MTAPHLAPGHEVAGKYTIRALLGFTGEVGTYHAIARDGREVVVKLHDPLVGQRADVMANLEKVHRLTAQLAPGGAIAPMDVGYDGGSGAPFTASEFLSVPSLDKLIETGPLTTEVVALVIQGLANVLDGAHAIGLHHLALKPTNIFVGPAPHYRVRVTDFDASVVRRTKPATQEGVARSAAWWAPEQLQAASVLGGPADVFTSALIAFYALTGRSYWHACQRQPPDVASLQVELMGPRAPVSQRGHELGAEVNPVFDGVFGRALSVNQADRPQSAMELANVLSAAHSSEQEAVTVAYEAPTAVESFTPPPAFGGDSAGFGGGGHAGAQAANDPNLAGPLPPFPQPVRKRRSSVLPIVIGVVAATLVGGSGVAFLFMRGSDAETPAPVVASTADTTEAASAPAASPAPAPPAASQASSPAVASASASASASAEDNSEVTIVCIPKCDRIELDGKEHPRHDGKFELAPGKYEFRLVKQGYLIHEEEVVVEAGKSFEKDFRLIKINIPKRKKKCGQFLDCPK